MDSCGSFCAEGMITSFGNDGAIAVFPAQGFEENGVFFPVVFFPAEEPKPHALIAALAKRVRKGGRLFTPYHTDACQPCQGTGMSRGRQVIGIGATEREDGLVLRLLRFEQEIMNFEKLVAGYNGVDLIQP